MFVTGFATEEEISALAEQGWDLEPASAFGLCGVGPGHLMTFPEVPKTEAVLIFIDASLVDICTQLGHPNDVTADLPAVKERVGNKEEQKVPVEIVGHELRMLEAQFEQRVARLKRACSHKYKYKDGEDATHGVAVSAERFCTTCGAQFD